MDYSKLKSAALAGAEDEEAVTVDTRALIDKVLARYSGEWTTLRELIQNAADAQASTVSIRWETLPSTTVPAPTPVAGTTSVSSSDQLKHVLVNHTIRRLVVRNDGQPFDRSDWARIKRIAEGNPDETKIGAFGVGFYSVFADCEEPFIASGDEAMAFYWKGNALFTKKSRLPPLDGAASRDTMFVLDYRNTTMAPPNLLSVCQFLATSLTFVSLRRIEFYIDDWRILTLDKTSAPSQVVAMPRHLNRRTAERLMEVMAVDQTSTQITATFISAVGWKKPAAVATTTTTTKSSSSDDSGASERPSLRSFFRRLQTAASQPSLYKTKAQTEEEALQDRISERLTEERTSKIHLRIASASVANSIKHDFAVELERATKKLPPKTTRLSILTASYNEAQASEAATTATSHDAISQAVDLFATVLPSRKPGGRVFIGFPTMQTTGAGMHVSAPSVIPTVEREAIDLNARYVRLWNMELLRAVGIMARLAYAQEMEVLRQKMVLASNGGGDKVTPDVVAKFMSEAAHILTTYAFCDSTPNSQVGQLIEEAFWTCFNHAYIEMYSSRGILPTTRVRRGFDELVHFMGDIPVVPAELKDLPFVKKLSEFGLITAVTHADILEELDRKSLTKEQTVLFMRWLAKRVLAGEVQPAEIRGLVNAAVCTLEDGGSPPSSKVVMLGAAESFLVTGKIPATMPLPLTTLPYALTASFSEKELKALGWKPLDIGPWVQYVVGLGSALGTEYDMSKSIDFATVVLMVVSKNWDNLGSESRSRVVNLLTSRPIMPTKAGLRLPSEAFFPTVKLFDDLPVVHAPLKEKMLLALGVRKTLDLETIFLRLLRPNEAGQKAWSHVELIKYLASVRNDIPAEDLKRLRDSKLCPAEGESNKPVGDGRPLDGKDASHNAVLLYRVHQLYEPKDELRALKLPLLEWPGRHLRTTSDEARFLHSLGLQLHPPIEFLVQTMASDEPVRRQLARRYYMANYQTHIAYNQANLGETNFAIMPVEGSTKLVPPSVCFTDPQSSVMGFEVLGAELGNYAAMFGVRHRPPMSACVDRLLAGPPRDVKSAIRVFEYFSTRLGDIDGPTLSRLEKADFIPIVTTKSSSDVTHVSPGRCYLGSSAEFAGIFDFVMFSQNADTFLFKCGVRSEPTKHEIADMICTEPARLLGVLGSPDRYLNLLRTLAEPKTLRQLKGDRTLWKRMQAAPLCLAYRELSAVKPSKGVGDKRSIGGSGGYYDDPDDDDQPMTIKQAHLAVARNVVIKDDVISYNIFKKDLACAPEDDVIESFYQSLGSQTLSSLVKCDIAIGAVVTKSEFAAQFKKMVIERSRIFLHQYAKLEAEIKHDAKWLEKGLSIEQVHSLSLRRTLNGVTHKAKRSAASHEPARDKAIIYVSRDSEVDKFQLGQALCQLLLSRPTLQAYTMFEPILTLHLLDLRARGYDVDRILRARKEEARIADEERRKAHEAEQSRLRQMQAQASQITSPDVGVNRAVAAAARDASAAGGGGGETLKGEQQGLPRMPGAFDSPPRQGRHARDQRDSEADPSAVNGFFSNLGKKISEWMGPESSGTGRSGPGSRSLTGGMHKNDSDNDNGDVPDVPSDDDGRVTDAAVVQRNLRSAVQSTRTFGANSVFSPPRIEQVKEQSTYCDSTSGQDLVLVSRAANGMRFFMSRAIDESARARVLATHADNLGAFSALLAELAGVYDMAASALHVFYDETGPTIAFNTQGSVFCNLRFYLQLHAQDSVAAADKATAGVWWWTVLAHELAHNLCATHSARHSYYTESFVHEYFGKMRALADRWGRERSMLAQGEGRDGKGLPPPYSAGAFE